MVNFVLIGEECVGKYCGSRKWRFSCVSAAEAEGDLSIGEDGERCGKCTFLYVFHFLCSV